MADEDISRVQFSLQLFEQLDDLSLNRNIQCGGRLVQDDQRRVDADGARDGDAVGHERKAGANPLRRT